MATDQGQEPKAYGSTCLESVNRISKLPVVESTIQTATSLYEKVKEYNNVTHWTLSTAENTVNKAVEVGKPIATPVIRNLEGPIKKVDDALCTGLDYIESKVPAVKLPPGEIYNSTKDYVQNTVTPAVESAYSYAEPAVKTARDIVEPAVESAKHYMEPAVETAKHYVEPAVEKAKSIVEPLVQPAMDTANAIKENVMHKVDEYLHPEHNHEDNLECQVCQDVRDKTENKTVEENQNN